MTFLRWPAGGMKSSNVVIGTASGFVALSALLSLLPEHPSEAMRDWTLRGTIAPAAYAAPETHEARARPGRAS